MSEVPRLTELAEDLPSLPAEVDTATALIAATEPKVLNHSVHQAFLARAIASIHSDDVLPKRAEQILDQVLNENSSRSRRQAARELLESRLQGQQAAISYLEENAPEFWLASQVDVKRLELSRPARWLATISCAAVLGGGGAFVTYKAAEQSNHDAVQSAVNYNKTAPKAYKVEVPQDELTGGQIGIIAGLGVGLSAAGGLVGTLIGIEGVNRRASHRRAKKIMRKAVRSE